jgi:hypothetical protein
MSSDEFECYFDIDHCHVLASDRPAGRWDPLTPTNVRRGRLGGHFLSTNDTCFPGALVMRKQPHSNTKLLACTR